MRKFKYFPAIIAMALAACGGGDDAFTGGSGGGGGDTNNAVTALTLITSSPTIPSDGSSPAQISAFARNASNQFVESVPVIFTASSGGLQITQNTTDANGLATATLSSAGDPTNRAITVTATSGTATATLNINVEGTTLVVQGPQALALGQQGSFTATLRDAGNDPIPGRTLTIASERSNTLSATSATTNANGQVAFTMTVANSGNDTVTVSGIGLSATQAVSVNSDSFQFTSPAPATEIGLNTPQNVSVTWTVNGAPVAGQLVSFSTTRGAVTPTSIVTDGSGVATVSVSATNAGGAVITAASGANSATLPLEFVALTPDSIEAQASSFAIATGQSSTITAVVRDATGNLVKNQNIDFTLADVTGGTLSVGTAVTDSQGRAQTVYTASSTTSANGGVVITARVRGTLITDDVALTVARREVFISLGTGNEITEPNTAQYTIEYVVQVTDSNGNGVPNVPVSMRLLSYQYFKGYRVPGAQTWLTHYTVTASTSFAGAGCNDEDADRDGTLDPLEDFNGNGLIDAGNIALVSPANVQTNADGFAIVHVSYPQEYAYYLQVDLSASTTVQGTEYVRTNRFMLPGSAEDFGNLQNSPPGPYSPFGVAAACVNPD